MFLVLFLYMLSASTFTLGKALLTYLQPFFLISIRMTLAGIALWGYVLLYKRKDWLFFKQWLFKKKNYLILIQLSLFHIYFSYMLEFWALKYVSSFKASLLYNLSPFITALFAYMLFSEFLSKKKILGFIVGLGGFVPILIANQPQEQLAGIWWFISLSDIILLLAVFSSVYGWIIFQRLTRKEQLCPVVLNGTSMIIGGLLALGTSFIIEGVPHLTVPSGMKTSIALLKLSIFLIGIIVIGNVIFYNLYGFLLRRFSATFLSFVGFSCPLFAAFFGWFFLKEVVTIHFFIAVAITFCGLYLFYQEELRLQT